MTLGLFLKSVFSFHQYISDLFVFGFFVWLVGFGFLRQGFSVALEPVLERALVDQAGLELTEILLPLLDSISSFLGTYV